MPQNPISESSYTPADFSELFAIPRTTLFRWEDNGNITKATRGPRGQRTYRQRHLRQVAKLVRAKCNQELVLASEYEEDRELPTLELLERLYIAEFVGQTEPGHGFQQLLGLARSKGLSSKTIRNLVRYASGRSPGDKARQDVWELLKVSDTSFSRR